MSTSPAPHDFPAVLRATLERRGLSSAELAERVSVSRNTVTNWTKGTYRPDHEHSKRIAMVLGLTIDELHGRTGAPSRRGHRPPRTTTSAAVADQEARGIVRRLAALGLEEALERIQRASPDLLRVLAEARAHAAREKDTGR